MVACFGLICHQKMATHKSVCVCVCGCNPLTMSELAEDGGHKSLGTGKSSNLIVQELMKQLMEERWSTGHRYLFKKKEKFEQT